MRRCYISRNIAALVLLLAAVPALASPQAALAAMAQDVRRLQPAVAEKTRYFHIPADLPEKLRASYRDRLLKFWANSLSREVDFGEPRTVSDEVLAVNLDDYQWSVATWETMAKAEPFWSYWTRKADGYLYRDTPPLLDPKQLAELAARTCSRVPVVRADWWLFYSSRGIDLDGKQHAFSYPDWLGVRKRADFEALRGVNKKAAIKLGLELRAALEAGRSGVSQQERQVEEYDTYGDGEYWRTLDTDDASGGNTAPGNLEDGAFRHKAEEAYITLPNSLWAFGLFDAAGLRQNTAPDFIGPNDSPHRKGRDGRIHYASCLHCHEDGGLKDIDDWARRTIKPPLRIEGKDLEAFKRLRRQYTGQLATKIDHGRQRYAKALRECVGVSSEEIAAEHAEAYYAYQLRAWTSADVAAALGVTEERLTKGIKTYFASQDVRTAADRKRLATVGGLVRGQTLPVGHVEQFWSDIQYIASQVKP